MTCSCSVRVSDAVVTIRPCSRHRNLRGAERWRWLEDVLSFAARFVEVEQLGPRAAAEFAS